MLNRREIKFTLKRFLPKKLLSVIFVLWKNIFLKLENVFQSVRLRKFAVSRVINLTHKNIPFDLFISPQNGYLDQQIYLKGVYEPFILDLIMKYLKPGDTFIDIGANIGHHSMFAAAITGKTGKVYSFEPIPRLFKQLQESVKVNKFDAIVTAYNMALGESNEEKYLYIDASNMGAPL